MAEEPERLGIGKVCRSCGARSATLGGVCPVCGRAYEPGGLLDRLPFLNYDPDNRYSMGLWLMACLAAVVVWILLLVTHPVTGILITALGLVVLVAAIGITNAMADRNR